MKRQSRSAFFAALLSASVGSVAVQAGPTAGEIVGWGGNGFGQLNVPAGEDFIAVSAGTGHGLALRSNGTLAGWGLNGSGQATVPAGNNYVAISAGGFHSMAIKSDGSLVGWGSNAQGQINVPAGTDFVAVAAGGDFSVALRSNGTLVAWGSNDHGQRNVPAGTTFVAITAGGLHAIALRSNGTLAGWGLNFSGQATVPGGTDFAAITGGSNFSLALKTDGSIVGWGQLPFTPGQPGVPPGNDFAAIAAGQDHSVALRTDGSLFVWGGFSSPAAVLTAPAGNNFVVIAAVRGGGLVSQGFSLAIRMVPPPCDDDDPCTIDEIVDEECTHTPVDEGSECDDGDPCSENDVCTSGECAGTPVDCGYLDDDCNMGICNESGDCVAVPRNNGEACGDGGSPCSPSACDNGACVSTPIDCSDDNLCTTDTCEAGECINAPINGCGDDPDPPFDGNNDGIPDDQQDHVASEMNTNGDMVTIVSLPGTTLTDVQSGGNPSPDDVPEGVEFPAGFVSFTVQGLAPGAAIEVQLILHVPEGTAINSYYKHGPTPDNPTPHWYDFNFDGTSGVTSITGNVITMTLVDGQRGDADLTANGTIVDPGAPAKAQTGPSPQPDPNCGVCAAGAMTAMFLLMVGMSLLKTARRRGPSQATQKRRVNR